MSHTEALSDFIAPLLPGWRIQFGAWNGDSRADRYAVIKPSGGAKADLVRRPQFTLILIGAEADGYPEIAASANTIIEAMRAASGSLVSLQPAEPVFMPTADGRAVFEIAVSAITN